MSILCEVVKIENVYKHPDADTLDIVPFGEFYTITRLGSFKIGDYGVYLAPGSILPDDMLRRIGMFDEVTQKGSLAGSGNRIKPKKLRGVVSEGIMYGPLTEEEVTALTGLDLESSLGCEVKDALGVKKFDPNVFDAATGKRLGGGDPEYCFTSKDRDCRTYDIENIKKHSRYLEDYFAQNPDQHIVVTEKIHGTNFPIVLIDNAARDEDLQYPPELCPGDVLVSSKGRLEKGNFLKPYGPAATTVYWQVAKALDVKNRCADARSRYGGDITLIGEIYGVQDLRYGVKTVDKISDFSYQCDELTGDLPYRLFDVYVGSKGNGRYLNDDELDDFCSRYKISRVPVLYRGPFDREKIREVTDGMETISGKSLHIREGVVVRACIENDRAIRGLGRLQVKSISDAYLIRQNGSEFN